MRGKLLQIYFNLRSSFWLIPMLMAVAGLLLAYATLYIDETAIGRNISGWLPVPQINVAGSRQIVSTVAGSVITVASLVFSLTFVALTLMSQQLGPRILVLFMDDRPTQLIIGFFVATFLYALMVLATIGTGAIENFAPQFSIYMVCFLAIFTFGLVIYFVHHIAQSLQADNVIATLGRELSNAIEQSLLSDTSECEDQQPEYQSGEEHQALREIGKPIRSRRSGYVQLVDYEAAVALAEEHDAVIRFPCRPGHFLISGAVVARVTSSSFLDDELNDQLCDLVQIGSQRSQAQYAEFEFNALVEVALRALSPGVNDAYTAIACINEITDGLARISRGRRRLDALMSDNGVIRVHRYPQSFVHFLNTAFHPIRISASAHVQVILHLAHSLNVLIDVAKRAEERQAIEHHVQLLMSDTRQSDLNDSDRQHILQKLAATAQRINSADGIETAQKP